MQIEFNEHHLTLINPASNNIKCNCNLFRPKTTANRYTNEAREEKRGTKN